MATDKAPTPKGAFVIVILSMKSREYYEDSIHDIIAKCLPRMDKSNIRPAYLKTKLNNPFAVNSMDKSDSMKDGTNAVRNKTNIVYFWWHFDPLDMLSTYVGDSVESIIPFRLTITCYGDESMNNAIRLKAFFRSPETLFGILNMQAVLGSEPRLTTFPEEINGEWWERTDVDIAFNVLVDDFAYDGAEPPANAKGIGTGYSTTTKGILPVEARALSGKVEVK